MEMPLILVTNDDGIDSFGLWAAVEAVMPLGEVLVVAPDRQWSGGGRSMPPYVSGRMTPYVRWVNGERVAAWAVDASPALAVEHGLLELAPRRPALVVSGINLGLNLATEVTISGTVGAALEAAAFGLPALAVSLEMESSYHLSDGIQADYVAAQSFTQRFAWHLLSYGLPQSADVLNVNVPAVATSETPWRVTRLSRQRYFEPVAPNRAKGEGRPGYRVIRDPLQAEMDSDIWAVAVERAVSVTPLSLDLTARVDPGWMDQELRLGDGECRVALDDLRWFWPCTQTAVAV